MPEQKPTFKIKSGNQIATLLSHNFIMDYEASINEFPKTKKIELIDHFLECFDTIESYYEQEEKKSIWKQYIQKEKDFLVKHGNRLKEYNRRKIFLYYGDSTVLIEKGIYTVEEYNHLDAENQEINPKVIMSFLSICRKLIEYEKIKQLLDTDPEEKKAEIDTGGVELSRKSKLKREANDKYTCLNLDQTALLIEYLQQEKAILKDEFLTDKEAGLAFELLTAYSRNTIRQKLGKVELLKSKQNLKDLLNFLTRMELAIDRDIKGR